MNGEGRVLKHLKEHGAITSWDAISLFGITFRSHIQATEQGVQNRNGKHDREEPIRRIRHLREVHSNGVSNAEKVLCVFPNGKQAREQICYRLRAERK